MDKNKLALGCLALIAVLFVVGMGTGLIPKQDGGLQKKSPPAEKNRAASERGKGGWMKIMDDLFAPFATPLDLKRLTFSPGCKKRSVDSFVLTESSPSCVITIPGSNKSYRQGKLRLKGRDPEVEIVYKPKGEEEDEFDWPPEEGKGEPIRVVALEGGGTLRLLCKNCNEDRALRVMVTFE